MTAAFSSSRQDRCYCKLHFILTCPQEDADCEVLPGPLGGLCEPLLSLWFSTHLHVEMCFCTMCKADFQDWEVSLMYYFAFGVSLERTRERSTSGRSCCSVSSLPSLHHFSALRGGAHSSFWIRKKLQCSLISTSCEAARSAWQPCLCWWITLSLRIKRALLRVVATTPCTPSNQTQLLQGDFWAHTVLWYSHCRKVCAI